MKTLKEAKQNKLNLIMGNVRDWIRITFLLFPCFFFCANVAHSLSIHSKKGLSESRSLERLSLEEANAKIALLRAHQKIKSCKISFDFIHREKNSTKSTITQGVLLVASFNQKIFKRLFLIDQEGSILVDYIFHEGDQSKAWKRLGGQSTFALIDESEMFSQFSNDILFRPVDVLMPYIHWDKFTYEGPRTYGISSVIQNYIFSVENAPGFTSNGILSVRVSIDSKYNSVRKIEYLNDTKILNELTVSGVKKFENLWIISRLVFKEKNNKTIFKVKQANVLPEDEALLFFDPNYGKDENIILFFD